MKTKFRILTFLFGLCAVGTLLGMGVSQTRAAASGAVITVTTNADEYDRTGVGQGCALREAIRAAEKDEAFGGCPTGNGDDTILLQATTYTNTREFDPNGGSGSFFIASNLTIQGALNGTTIVDGGGNAIARTVFSVGIGYKVKFNKLIVQNGAAAQDGGGIEISPEAEVTMNNSTVRNNRAAGHGGGIFNQGNLKLKNVIVRDNASQGVGGGIANRTYESYPSAILSLDDSAVNDNTSESQGGGVFNEGSVTVLNTTIDGNSAGANGGGIWNDGIAVLRFSTVSSNFARAGGGGIETSELLTAVNVTISGNRARYNGGGISNYATAQFHSSTIALNVADADRNNADGGGGIYSPNNAVLVRNSIIGDNRNLDSLITAHNDDCKGNLHLGSYNLLETTAGCTLEITQTNNLLNRDPRLDPLADNGGATRTQALRANSPAIDAANPNGCMDANGKNLVADQRGYLRTINGDGIGSARCDMGAFEYGSIKLPKPTVIFTATPTKTAAPTQTPTLPSSCNSKPAAPTLKKPDEGATVSTRRVTLNWNDILCTQQYKVRVRQDTTNGTFVDKKSGLGESDYRTKRLAKGHVYFWRVLACNEHGCAHTGWRAFEIH